MRSGSVKLLVSTLLLASSVASAQSLGRLFSTVEQRIELDEARDEYEYGKPTAPPESIEGRDPDEAERASVPQLTVNGVVLRSSGNNASWVNGTTILSGQASPEGIRVEPRRGVGGTVRLVLPSGVDTQPIKPGQRIDVVNGKVIDTFRPAKQRKGSSNLFSSPPEPGSASKAPPETQVPNPQPSSQ